MRDSLVRHSAVLPLGGNVITEDIIEACSILKRNAELLKREYGSTWPGENSDTDVVSIPVMQGYPSKEISLRDLSKVIYARMDEILDNINNEINTYHQMEPGRQLIGGVVLTGGGALLRHLQPFTHYKTGMNSRIGLPNVYVEASEGFDIDSPMYSTCIGLLLSAPDGQYVESPSAVTEEEQEIEKPVYDTVDDTTDDDSLYEDEYEDVEETIAQNAKDDIETKSPSTTPAQKVKKTPSDRPSFIKTLKEKTEKKIEDVSTRTNKAILDFLQKLGD
jgi:cell division protein FtsA